MQMAEIKTFWVARTTFCRALKFYSKKPQPAASYNGVQKKLDINFPVSHHDGYMFELYWLDTLVPFLREIPPGGCSKVELVITENSVTFAQGDKKDESS